MEHISNLVLGEFAEVIIFWVFYPSELSAGGEL